MTNLSQKIRTACWKLVPTVLLRICWICYPLQQTKPFLQLQRCAGKLFLGLTNKVLVFALNLSIVDSGRGNFLSVSYILNKILSLLWISDQIFGNVTRNKLVRGKKRPTICKWSLIQVPLFIFMEVKFILYLSFEARCNS